MIDDPLARDFRKFLWLVWQHIGLPDPTPLQYDIARYMHIGPSKICIEAFRGVGKSFIAAAFVLFLLRNNPQLKILVVSASKTRADAFSTFCMRLIMEMDILAHLRPGDDQRNSRIEFDVAPAVADQSPSVKSVGIGGQITGTRADIIIADDCEVLNNSATSDMREKLLERLKEFSAVIKPLKSSRIIYLGTPQTEDSIYNKLPETFQTQIWPARIPTDEEAVVYGSKLARYVAKLMQTGLAGLTTDPQRFSDEDLLARESEYGRAGFMLQFMLNTQLSDEDRFPLKVKDLIIMDVDKDKAPMKVNWLPDTKRELKDLPNLAMAGDRFYSVASHDETFAPFTSTVMSIDPSGRGKDETGYAVVKMLNGFLFVTKAGGLPGGYDQQTLQRLAMIARDEGVNHIIIEANFGDGMYTKLFEPVIRKIHPCAVEEVKHSIQKERRIIDTLEPVISRHRLIMDKSIILDDYRTAQAYDADNRYTKTLIHQMTRISFEKGSLKHDDRLDALAIAVAYHSENMAQDADRNISSEKQARLEKELEKFLDHATAGRRGKDQGSWRLGSGLTGARML
jgi:Holliday junction resolvasome RuvABC endonuclease subunit